MEYIVKSSLVVLSGGHAKKGERVRADQFAFPERVDQLLAKGAIAVATAEANTVEALDGEGEATDSKSKQSSQPAPPKPMTVLERLRVGEFVSDLGDDDKAAVLAEPIVLDVDAIAGSVKMEALVKRLEAWGGDGKGLRAKADVVKAIQERIDLWVEALDGEGE